VLLVAVFFLQSIVGSGAALRMWAGSDDPLGIAASICFGQPTDGTDGDGTDRGSGLPGHDHGQCLLCHVGIGSGTLPAAVLLPVVLAVDLVVSLPAAAPMPSRPEGFICLPRGPPAAA